MSAILQLRRNCVVIDISISTNKTWTLKDKTIVFKLLIEYSINISCDINFNIRITCSKQNGLQSTLS